MDILLWILVVIGNLGVWFTIYNRVHATPLPRTVRKTTEKVCAVMVVMSFGWLALSVISCKSLSIERLRELSWAHQYYIPACAIFGVLIVIGWSLRKYFAKPNGVLEQRQTLIDLQQKIGSSVYESKRARLLSSIPFNQSHMLAIEEVTMSVPRLPKELDGLKIAHISDLHLMRMLSREWFEQTTAETNRYQPDLVLVTGDLVDEDQCLDWLDSVFGKLESKYGVFFIRGNHDRRISSQKVLLQKLADCSMTWVGDGKWHSVTINECPIEIAGNELPWFKDANHLPAVPGSGGITNPHPFRILLSHSPDQHPWGLERGFDLILAGHCHGGQIQLPFIGPLVAPSNYGVRFAGGTFRFGASVMRVSRGLSGDKCIRICCPPEVGILTLKSA